MSWYEISVEDPEKSLEFLVRADDVVAALETFHWGHPEIALEDITAVVHTAYVVVTPDL